MCADIPMSVLDVPAGKEGEPGACGGINVVARWKQSEIERDRVHLCNICD